MTVPGSEGSPESSGPERGGMNFRRLARIVTFSSLLLLLVFGVAAAASVSLSYFLLKTIQVYSAGHLNAAALWGGCFVFLTFIITLLVVLVGRNLRG